MINKSYIARVAFAVLICAACNNVQKKEEKATERATAKAIEQVAIDTISKTAPSNSQNLPEELVGFYRTNLPCKGCDSIQHTTALYEGGTFLTEKVELGKNQPPLLIRGIIEQDDQLLKLKSGDISIYLYKRIGQQLYLATRAANGKETKYLLKRIHSPLANKAWQEKKEKAVKFFGVGNEPFWNVEIDSANNVQLKMADWLKPVQLSTTTTSSGAETITFNGTYKGSKVGIQILHRFCSDGMSDYLYDRSVNVKYRDHNLTGCGAFFR